MTPQQKLNDKQRKGLKILINQVKGAWSFGELQTWGDVYKRLGFDPHYIQMNFPPDHSAKPLTYPELKSYLEKMEQDLENAIKQRESEPEHEKGETIKTSYTEVLSKERTDSQPIGIERKKASSSTNTGQNTNTNMCASTQVIENVLEEETALTAKGDYGLIPSPHETAFLYWFQKKAVKQMLDKVIKEKRSGILLLSSTGTGKTYMEAALLRRLIDARFHVGKTLSYTPYLNITRTTVVEQKKRAFRSGFGLECPGDAEVINIEKLRTKEGRLWVTTKTLIEDGEEVEVYKWKPGFQPCVVLFDESQAAKNQKSKQSKIMSAYTELLKNAVLVSISATPFTRVSEAKVFAVSTHRPLGPLYGLPEGSVLTNETWPTYAAIISSPSKPEEYNETAVERLCKDLEPWIVRVKGVRPQFQAYNHVEKIRFKTQQEREFYAKTMERFHERKKKHDDAVLHGLEPEDHIFVILQQLSMSAEICRAEQIADRMVAKEKEGFAACAAVKWKPTLIAIEQFLENKYGISRDNISLIWGGGQTELTEKQKAKKAFLEKKGKLKEMGIDVEALEEDMELDKIEDRELLNLPASSRLGMQNLQQRQIEIDNFQSGKSHFCIYTFKAGGVGLSLHHTDELTEYKVKRKESGYAVEEDIKNCPTRPRFNIVAPTYNPMELVQGVGRCPRLTSLSNTEQILLFYTGTIEDDIADIVSQKLRCLSKVVKMPENWQDMIVGSRTKESFEESTKDLKDDEAGTIVEESEDEDE